MTRKELILKATENGKVVGLGFIKRSTGKLRTGAFRRGVVKGITGDGLKFKPSEHDLITLYDMNAKGYRNIPLDNLTFVKGLGKRWEILDDGIGYRIVEKVGV
tara:strand:- start:632 stop:940 length:309 start_codon:yes stop_codon:yes gene_type:complete